ncbi:MAG: hypothetical protein N2512_15655 [Armatimonadetes bacterium]|nr:hypothetical protein [Armatimonadota bacterium]
MAHLAVTIVALLALWWPRLAVADVPAALPGYGSPPGYSTEAAPGEQTVLDEETAAQATETKAEAAPAHDLFTTDQPPETSPTEVADQDVGEIADQHVGEVTGQDAGEVTGQNAGEVTGQNVSEAATSVLPAQATDSPPEDQAETAGMSTQDTEAAPSLSEDQVEVKADKVFMTEDILAGSGNVVVRTQDYTITAETVELDRRSNVARFRGRVVIEGQDQRTEGDALWVDLDEGSWKLEPATTTVQPEFFAGGILAPLYARGGEVAYDPDVDRVKVLRGEATSCDLAEPHYALKSARVTVRPDDYVTFHRPALYVLGRRILRYPFDVTLSLREKEQRIFPEIGSNEVEGKYLKFAFLYLLGARGSGVLRLHLTELRGIGLGVDHLFEDRRQSLFVSLFDEPSQGAQALRVEHDYQFGRTLSSQLGVNYQKDSGFTFASTTLSSDLTFRNSDANSDTTLGFARSLTTSGYGSSSRFAANLYHNQRQGRDTNWNLRSTFTSSNFGATAASDQELLVDFQYRHRAPSYDMDLYLSQRQDIDGSRYEGDRNYYALNRLPALSFRTDSGRLGGWRLFGRSSARFQLDLGNFVQDPQDQRLGRLAFTADLGGNERELSPHTTVRTGLRFRQSLFDEGSAQYSLSFDGEVRRDFGKKWHARLGYDYASTRGFAPLRLDYGGVANDLRLQLVRLSPDSSRFELSGGYDFVRDAYYDLRLLFERRASEAWYWRLQTAYSIEQARWWPLVLRLTTARPSLYLDLSASYDLDRSKLSVVTADADWRIGRWWRLEFVGSYSGWTGRLDQADVRLTRDLHCLVAQLTWSKWPRQLYFTIGIKAFPSETRMLGVGATGAYLPGTPGEYY